MPGKTSGLTDGNSAGLRDARRYRLLTVSDLSHILQSSKPHVRKLVRSGRLPAALEIGVGGSQPGQVQRWRPEEVADRLGISVASVLEAAE